MHETALSQRILFHPVRLPWFTAVRLLGTSNPTLTNPTLRGEYKSAYMKKNFTDAQVGSMWTHLTPAVLRRADQRRRVGRHRVGAALSPFPAACASPSVWAAM
ncbi:MULTISPECIES: hypothetical protein [unclassified Streptomyces]|uniref:hypothetical protein n=1 Tax=unclassified Streptomyces TaxID=2593676 RepID=UPI002035AF7C|nr:MULTISPECIES: hypothetical protein [unclassified Streptomyces]